MPTRQGTEIDACWGTSRQVADVVDLTTARRQIVDYVMVKQRAQLRREDIDQLPKLKKIGRRGTGYGGIDSAYAAERGITATNIAEYATTAVEEFTFGIVMENLRAIAKAKKQASTGN